MNLEKLKKEIKAKEEINNFFKLFGINEDIKHIIGESDKNPTITFKIETKDDLKRIITSVKPSLLYFYKESNGTTGFKPILQTELNYLDENKQIKNNCTLSKSLFRIDTQTNKYNSNQTFKIVCYLERNKNQYFTLWIETKLDFFKDYYFNETIKDVYETETAKKYNSRHTDIYTTRPIFKDFTAIKFHGGNVSHITTTEEQNDILNKMFKEVL